MTTVVSYRKKVYDPLAFYNAYIQSYNKYFNNFYTPTRKRELNNKKIENYLINFSETYFHKLDESMEEFKKYVVWCFSKYDKIPIFSLHLHIDKYLKDGTVALESFWFKVVSFIQKNKITWEEYVKGTASKYPKIIEHYTSTKDIPIEFIIYLRVLDNLTTMQKSCMKVVLRHEYIDWDKKLTYVKNNVTFFKYELDKIDEVLKNG